MIQIRLFNLSSTTVLHLALALAISALKWLTGRKRWCVRPLCKLYHRQSRDRWCPHLGASRIPMEKTKKIRFLVRRHSRHYQDSILDNGIKELFESHNNSKYTSKGGCQLLDLIITELESHMTCYNSMPLIGWNYSIQTGEQIL